MCKNKNPVFSVTKFTLNVCMYREVQALDSNTKVYDKNFFISILDSEILAQYISVILAKRLPNNG